MRTSIERDRRGINYKGKWEEREEGWRSDESTRLPPMLPGFKSLRRRHMWVEFVVGSLLCSERFFSGDSGGFPHSSKPTFSNSNSIWNARTRLNEFIWILFASLRGKIGIYKFFLQFTILGGGGWKRRKLDAWYIRTTFPSFLRPLVAVNFRLVQVLVLVFPSS